MNASPQFSRRAQAISWIALVMAWWMGHVSAFGGSSFSEFYHPPEAWVGKLGPYRSPLLFTNGQSVAQAQDWSRRRREILDQWHAIMGPWPPLLQNPKLEYLKSTRREQFTQHKVRVEIASQQTTDGYLLVPDGPGPFPGVVVPYYEAETSIGLGKERCDFAYQLTRRGFVSLSIGSPGGDARAPEVGQPLWQPLSYLAYVAANCHTVLAQLGNVDPKRIGIVGHSYGGKWAMFASCLYAPFACAAWSDPGVVFDETRPNVNYWERWYLGAEPGRERSPGVPAPDNPRTGAYKVLVEAGHDLHELHALMAPRSFLVSGGSEDPLERWAALNHTIRVNALLGQPNKVAMTHRSGHSPTPESNAQIYLFFEQCLNPKPAPEAPP